MNMKKTIAAVAACAMAVSAMATTVSAVSEGATEAQKVHYDLTIKEKVKGINFTAAVNEADSSDMVGIEIVMPTTVAESFGDEINITIRNKTTEKNYDYTFTAKKDDVKYDGVALKLPVVNPSAAGNTIDNTKVAYVIDLNTTNNGSSLLKAFVGANVDFALSFSANTLKAKDQEDLNKKLKSGDVTIKALATVPALTKVNGVDVYAPVGTVTTGAVPAVTAATETTAAPKFNIRGAITESIKTMPMKTNSNVNSDPATTDVFAQLAKTGSKEVGKSYVNASAVINDMIANYDEVVFTFNTAKEKVANGEYASWGNIDCTKFPQQLYNLFGDENTGYVYANSPTYTFNNLFNAALVANKDLTMNQNAIAPFVYNATSVSFEWDTMTATGGKFVSAASAIRTLQLATSSDWYWDSMDVVGYKAAVEDTESKSPVEADEEDLDDTDAEIDDTDDADAEIDDTDDADVDDADTDDVDDTDDADADDTTDEGDAAADETTGNPETGNAPIALAVIPVALAAAAVVAKKRG